MSDEKNPVQKSVDYAKAHNFQDHITIDNSGIKVSQELIDNTYLAAGGITAEQAKKLHTEFGKLYPAIVNYAAPQVAQVFKDNPETSEIGFNFDLYGPKVAGVFNRDGKDHFIGAVTHEYKNAEMKRVIASINPLFDDINS